MNRSKSVSVQFRRNTLFSVAVVSGPVALLGGRAHAETNAILAVRELLADATATMAKALQPKGTRT